MKRYYYYRCTCVNKKGWQACATKEVSADRMENYVLENLQRISVDRDYLDNLVFKLNHGSDGSNPGLKNSALAVKDGLEPSRLCSKFSRFDPETVASLLRSFLLFLSQRRGVERNLLVKRFIQGIVYSQENIKITLFYSENLKDFQVSQIKENPAFLEKGGANFSGASHEGSLPPHPREFVSNLRVGTRGFEPLTFRM